MNTQSPSWHGRVIEVHQRSDRDSALRESEIARRRVLVEVKGGVSVSLASPDMPYHRYCVRANGQLTVHEGVSKGSVFIVEMIESAGASGGTLYRFRSPVPVPRGSDVGEVAYYLSVHVDGTLSCTMDSTDGSDVLGCDPSTLLCAEEQASVSSVSDSTPGGLTRWQKNRFVAEGYLVVNDVVGAEELEQCQRLLMHNLGVPGAVHAGGTQAGLGKLGGHLSHAPEVRRLITPEVRSVLASLFGENGIAGVASPRSTPTSGACPSRSKSKPVYPFPTAQIALRFPDYSRTDTSVADLNGVEWHTDGFRRGKTHEFSVLLGICLTDCSRDYMGNLLVWPQTHTLIHRCLSGPFGDIDKKMLAQLAAEAGLIESVGSGSEDPTQLPSLGFPYQVKLRKGDIVLLHPETAHCGGPNFSSTIRSMVYFRLKSTELFDFWQLAGQRYTQQGEGVTMNANVPSLAEKNWASDGYLSDMWIDFKGVSKVH